MKDKKIAVEFDPGFMREIMLLWRDSLDMKMPVHDKFKVHFIVHRRGILENYVKTGKAWSMFLNAMIATASADDLDELRAEVLAFVGWAENGLAELAALK